MSFILRHRPHRRLGLERLVFERKMEHDGYEYNLRLTQGGYVFELEQPLLVNVLEGNVKGKLKAPIGFAVPKFNAEWGAYLTPDGGAVQVRGNQLINVPKPLYPVDAGVPSILPPPSAAPPPSGPTPPPGQTPPIGPPLPPAQPTQPPQPPQPP